MIKYLLFCIISPIISIDAVIFNLIAGLFMDMKRFIYIFSFALLTVFPATLLHAQTIEQISYVPVKKGHYTNLIVKKQTQITGNLTVNDTLTSNATTLHINTNNISLADNVGFNVLNNITLTGKYITLGTVAVADSNNLIIKSPSTTIQNLEHVSSISSKNLYLSKDASLNNIFIDGLRLPNDCTYTWHTVQTANASGTYKILGCTD